MAKYGKMGRQAPPKSRPWDIHPIWQGIGCLLMIMIPVMAYAGAVLLVQANVSQGWVPISAELSRPVNIPNVGSFEYLFANLLVAAILAMLGFGLLVAIYSLVYRAVGPSRLGPLDADPIRRKTKRSR